MKQILPDIIRENRDLQQLLLAQEGGIIKYLAQHLDVRGSELFINYQEQCDNEYFDAHEWDIGMTTPRDEMRRKALGKEHIERELCYQTDLEATLTGKFPVESSTILEYVEKYLKYAYDESRKRDYPNGQTPRELYEEVMGKYRANGYADDCMKAVLIEHQSHVSIERTHWGRNTMFFVRMFSRVIGSQVEPVLRRAVAEILEGKTQEEARHIAVTMMKEVKSFSRMIYNDAPQTVHYLGFDVGVIKVDKERLRSVAIRHYQKKNAPSWYFSNFVFLLMQIGRIWAAQLLANHGIDMHDLEKETGCILKPAEIGDYDYYVDKLIGDTSLSQRYVVDEEHARQLLSKIKHVDPMEEEHQIEQEKQDADAHKRQMDAANHKEALPPSNNGGVSTPPAPHENKQPRQRGRKSKTFEDFIHDDAPKELLLVLEEMMEGASGRKALTIILSITDVYIDKPTNKSVCDRFNTVGETAYGEAVARHNGTTYGKNDFSNNPNPISETELTSMRDKIIKRIEELQK